MEARASQSLSSLAAPACGLHAFTLCFFGGVRVSSMQMGGLRFPKPLIGAPVTLPGQE